MKLGEFSIFDSFNSFCYTKNFCTYIRTCISKAQGSPIIYGSNYSHHTKQNTLTHSYLILMCIYLGIYFFCNTLRTEDWKIMNKIVHPYLNKYWCWCWCWPCLCWPCSCSGGAEAQRQTSHHRPPQVHKTETNPGSKTSINSR